MIKKTIKEIKEIIDKQKLTEDMLDGCGISTARFCLQFFNPKQNQKEYNKIYNYLFSKFQELK